MAYGFGSGVQAGLGATDYSNYLRGALAGAQMQAQGGAAIGQGIASGLGSIGGGLQQLGQYAAKGEERNRALEKEKNTMTGAVKQAKTFANSLAGLVPDGGSKTFLQNFATISDDPNVPLAEQYAAAQSFMSMVPTVLEQGTKAIQDARAKQVNDFVSEAFRSGGYAIAGTDGQQDLRGMYADLVAKGLDANLVAQRISSINQFKQEFNPKVQSFEIPGGGTFTMVQTSEGKWEPVPQNRNQDPANIEYARYKTEEFNKAQRLYNEGNIDAAHAIAVAIGIKGNFEGTVTKEDLPSIFGEKVVVPPDDGDGNNNASQGKGEKLVVDKIEESSGKPLDEKTPQNNATSPSSSAAAMPVTQPQQQRDGFVYLPGFNPPPQAAQEPALRTYGGSPFQGVGQPGFYELPTYSSGRGETAAPLTYTSVTGVPAMTQGPAPRTYGGPALEQAPQSGFYEPPTYLSSQGESQVPAAPAAVVAVPTQKKTQAEPPSVVREQLAKELEPSPVESAFSKYAPYLAYGPGGYFVHKAIQRESLGLEPFATKNVPTKTTVSRPGGTRTVYGSKVQTQFPKGVATAAVALPVLDSLLGNKYQEKVNEARAERGLPPTEQNSMIGFFIDALAQNLKDPRGSEGIKKEIVFAISKIDKSQELTPEEKASQITILSELLNTVDETKNIFPGHPLYKFLQSYKETY